LTLQVLGVKMLSSSQTERVVTIKAKTLADPRNHVVMFYERDEELADAVGDFLVDGYNAGESTIVVATADHIDAFEAALDHRGFDVDALRRDGALLTLEAAEAMAGFLRGDWPDERAFDDVIGAMVRRATRGTRRVRVYGEMVALLWDADHVNAAIELEALWNELARHVDFTLMCAYSAKSVAGAANKDSFQSLCHAHSEVMGDHAAVGDVSREFPCRSDSLAEVRQFVAETLRAWRFGRLVDDGSLIVSELATNAVLHGGSNFSVGISSGGDGVRVSVRDHSGELPVLRSPSPTTISGRGLLLIAGVARAWGIEVVDGGKVVWADLHR
jgi:anti-sigma regulatory factor (Ser/Thr protein kinase)